MNLQEFTVERDGRGILLKGVTHAPITWETTVRIGPRDIGSILRLAVRPAMLRLGLAWVLHQGDRPGPGAADAPERIRPTPRTAPQTAPRPGPRTAPRAPGPAAGTTAWAAADTTARAAADADGT